MPFLKDCPLPSQILLYRVNNSNFWYYRFWLSLLLASKVFALFVNFNWETSFVKFERHVESQAPIGAERREIKSERLEDCFDLFKLAHMLWHDSSRMSFYCEQFFYFLFVKQYIPKNTKYSSLMLTVFGVAEEILWYRSNFKQLFTSPSASSKTTTFNF